MNKTIEYLCGLDFCKENDKTDKTTVPIEFMIGRICPLGLESLGVISLFQGDYSKCLQAVAIAEVFRAGGYLLNKTRNYLDKRESRCLIADTFTKR